MYYLLCIISQKYQLNYMEGKKMIRNYQRLFILSFILFFLILSYNAFSAEEGLVAYWSFDDGKDDTAKDLTGNKNDGNIKGKSQWVIGKSGTALAFAKADAISVEIADNPTINIAEQITMSAWIKPSAIYIGGDWKERNCVIAKVRAYYLDINETGNLASYLYGVQPLEWLAGKTDMTKFIDKWVHVATVYDGKEHKLYIDGKLDASVKKSGNIAVAAENLHIGWVDNNRYFDGVIDEVMLWSKGMTEDELIRSLAVNPKLKMATCWGMQKSFQP